MNKWRIEAKNDDQQWLDSFNYWNRSNYKLGELIEPNDEEFINLRSAVSCFNHTIAQGAAIYLVEV